MQHNGDSPWRDRLSTAEVSTVVELIRTHRAGLVNVGHGRQLRSIACASAFVAWWEETGGQIGTVVSWPPVAASWLRAARRLVSGAPDAWVVADTIEGWAGVGRRLASTGSWRVQHTVAFAGLADARLPAVAGSEASEGLRGALPDGTSWAFRDGSLVLGATPQPAPGG